LLRKQDTGWRLLAASSNPMLDSVFLQRIPAISERLDESAMKETSVAPAQLLSPENGQVPSPDAGQRFGYFIWRRSPSVDVVAQILEVAYQNDDWLFFVPIQSESAMDELPSGSRRNPGTAWKWRVWSISGSGTIAFSDYRSFRK